MLGCLLSTNPDGEAATGPASSAGQGLRLRLLDSEEKQSKGIRAVILILLQLYGR